MCACVSVCVGVFALAQGERHISGRVNQYQLTVTIYVKKNNPHVGLKNFTTEDYFRTVVAKVSFSALFGCLTFSLV